MSRKGKVLLERGMTWEEARSAFLEAQAGCCAICRKDITARPNLDHCHRTGFLRGVLCASCNTKLGWYEGRRREIEAYLARAAEYIAHRPDPDALWPAA